MLRVMARLIAGGYLAIVLVVALVYLAVGGVGYAPLPLPLGAARAPIRITIWHDAALGTWLAEAAQRFAASGASVSGRPVEIVLLPLDGPAMRERLTAGDTSPTAVIPAHGAWLDAADDSASVASSPMVLLAWEARAQLLGLASGDALLTTLQRALVDPAGWAAYGGQAGWGAVKLGITTPLRDAGALGVATLVAAGDEAWLDGVAAATEAVDPAAAPLETVLAQYGPSRFDVVLVTEQVALSRAAAISSRWGAVRIFTPAPTPVNRYPFVIPADTAARAEQRAAATAFRRFLLDDAQQAALAAHGLRRADGTPPAQPDLGGAPDVRELPLDGAGIAAARATWQRVGGDE
jgi:hypothetical protein